MTYIRPMLLSLLLVFTAASANAETIEQRTNEAVCKEATFFSGTKKWSTSTYARKYIIEAKKRSLTCGVKNQKEDTRVCSMAVTTYNNKVVWEAQAKYRSYVEQAKKRGLSCGVGTVVREKIDKTTDTLSDTSICKNAVSYGYGNKKTWDIRRSNAAYVKEAKTRGLSCGVEGTNTQTAKDIQSSLWVFSDLQLCNTARELKNNKIVWKTHNSYQKYVTEAKRRGLSCGVGSNSSSVSKSLTSYSDLQLCYGATKTSQGIKSWNFSSTYSKSLVTEAKSRGLSCGVSTQTVSGASTLPKCVGSYNQDTWTDCIGIYTSANGNKYVGEFKDGKWNGKGTLTYASGDKYVGGFKNDKIQGYGTYTWANGTEYVGEYKDGQKHGQGIITFADGEKYTGGYKNGKKNGQGTYTFASGSKYVGEYKNGKIHGYGTYTFGEKTPAAGNKYVGEFENNMRNGQGTYTYANGDKYVGEFKNEARHGKGTHTYANGKIEEGIFKDDVFQFTKKVNTQTASGASTLPKCVGSLSTWTNCYGTITFASGSKYVGEWKDGNYHGQGTYTFASGSKYVGEYKDGKRNGQGTYTYANGDKYVGEWKDGNYHGQGTYTWINGSKYAGEYKDDKRNGQGTYTYANGDKYVGEFKDGKKNGQATFTYANGKIEEGIFKDDVFQYTKKVNTQTASSSSNDLAEKLDSQICNMATKGSHKIWETGRFSNYVAEAKSRGLSCGVSTQTASGASTLPKCVGARSILWQNCFGTYTYANGDKYVGEFQDDKMHGQGTYTYASGSKYVGEYKDGKRNGQGTYTYANGDKYAGEYKDDKRNGQGTYTFGPNSEWAGDKYVGEYKDDKRNGQGTYTYANGDKYAGEYKDGKRNGQGTYTFGPNSEWAGDKYVGEYKDDKRNGQGTYTFAGGSIKEGIFKDNKFVRAKKIKKKKAHSLTFKDLTDIVRNSFISLSSNDRKGIQTKLKGLGLYNSSIDGLFGQNTHKAIIGYKQEYFPEHDLTSTVQVSLLLQTLLKDNKSQQNTLIKVTENPDNDYVTVTLPQGIQFPIPKNWQNMTGSKGIIEDFVNNKLYQHSDKKANLGFAAKGFDANGDVTGQISLSFLKNETFGQKVFSSATDADFKQLAAQVEELNRKGMKISGLEFIEYEASREQLPNGDFYHLILSKRLQTDYKGKKEQYTIINFRYYDFERSYSVFLSSPTAVSTKFLPVVTKFWNELQNKKF